VKIGEWVMAQIIPEQRDGKLAPRFTGPWRITWIDQRGNCDLRSPIEEGQEMSKVAMRTLSKYKGEHPGARVFAPSEGIDLQEIRKLAKGKAQIRKVDNVIEDLKEQLGIEGKVHPHQLFQQRVEVFWTQTGDAGGWQDGTIVDYCPITKRFYVKYDEMSIDGNHTIPERLFAPNMPDWNILNSEDESGEG
jgi:hypothetical protein